MLFVCDEWERETNNADGKCVENIRMNNTQSAFYAKCNGDEIICTTQCLMSAQNNALIKYGVTKETALEIRKQAAAITNW